MSVQSDRYMRPLRPLQDAMVILDMVNGLGEEISDLAEQVAVLAKVSKHNSSAIVKLHEAVLALSSK